MRAPNKRVSSPTQPLFFIIYHCTQHQSVKYKSKLPVASHLGGNGQACVPSRHHSKSFKSIAEKSTCRSIFLPLSLPVCCWCNIISLSITKSPEQSLRQPYDFCSASRSARHSKVVHSPFTETTVILCLYFYLFFLLRGDHYEWPKLGRLENCCEWMLR